MCWVFFSVLSSSAAVDQYDKWHSTGQWRAAPMGVQSRRKTQAHLPLDAQRRTSQPTGKHKYYKWAHFNNTVISTRHEFLARCPAVCLYPSSHKSYWNFPRVGGIIIQASTILLYGHIVKQHRRECNPKVLFWNNSKNGEQIETYLNPLHRHYNV